MSIRRQNIKKVINNDVIVSDYSFKNKYENEKELLIFLPDNVFHVLRQIGRLRRLQSTRTTLLTAKRLLHYIFHEIQA